MKLSSFSVILTFVILMIVGAALLPLVDVGTEPQNQRDNRLVIRCEWPQVSAKIVEQNLTTPIEGMVSAERCGACFLSLFLWQQRDCGLGKGKGGCIGFAILCYFFVAPVVCQVAQGGWLSRGGRWRGNR